MFPMIKQQTQKPSQTKDSFYFEHTSLAGPASCDQEWPGAVKDEILHQTNHPTIPQLLVVPVEDHSLLKKALPQR
jgi:hypothetical protein